MFGQFASHEGRQGGLSIPENALGAEYGEPFAAGRVYIYTIFLLRFRRAAIVGGE